MGTRVGMSRGDLPSGDVSSHDLLDKFSFVFHAFICAGIKKGCNNRQASMIKGRNRYSDGGP